MSAEKEFRRTRLPDQDVEAVREELRKAGLDINSRPNVHVGPGGRNVYGPVYTYSRN